MSHVSGIWRTYTNSNWKVGLQLATERIDLTHRISISKASSSLTAILSVKRFKPKSQCHNCPQNVPHSYTVVHAVTVISHGLSDVVRRPER